jgi:hypothetical protein
LERREEFEGGYRIWVLDLISQGSLPLVQLHEIGHPIYPQFGYREWPLPKAVVINEVLISKLVDFLGFSF